MNELIILVMAIWAGVAVCIITAAIENRRAIGKYIASKFVALGEWLFDVQSAYYKMKQHRRARR